MLSQGCNYDVIVAAIIVVIGVEVSVLVVVVPVVVVPSLEVVAVVRI